MFIFLGQSDIFCREYSG